MRLRGNEDRGGEEGELITPHLLITHAARDRQTTTNQSIAIFHRRVAADATPPNYADQRIQNAIFRYNMDATSRRSQPIKRHFRPKWMVFFLINPFSFRLKGKSGC